MEVVYKRAITKDAKLKRSLKSCIASLKSATDITEIPAAKKLSKHPSAYKIRLGKYRLGFYLEDDTITLARFAKRPDIYKSFPS